ncbi:MAG: hypothetical protein DCC68_10720 [Planctomycetota bacterium]|nr:MAG: hypothetical protein DCC68_10720 [Planctomycetota bacterium]
MKMNKATSVEEFKLVSSFESLRKTLLQERYSDRLDRPLAFWALPSDRRLPLAFLGRSIGELLNTPFADLNATPGIGQKKISSLIKLLARATRDEPPAVPFGVSDNEPAKAETSQREELPAGFDPMCVSEALWVQWRDTVRRLGLGYEKLGRLAPSLQELPTVIWHTPLDQYVDRTLDEIRNLKTHGEKRVRVVLEVFCVVHQMLVDAGPQDHLVVRLAPRFVVPIENWIRRWMDQPGVPSADEVLQNLANPLIEQLTVDAGETVIQLAKGRLGLDGPPQSVRTQSRRMGVTRARVYQLLDECSKVMGIRWPEGQAQLRALCEKVRAENADGKVDTKLLDATVELFFPRKYDALADADGDQDEAEPATQEFAEV